jgi:hypothetical protein
VPRCSSRPTLTEACGGYGSDVYEIVYDYLVSFKNDGICTKNPKSLKCNGIWPLARVS